MKEVSHSINMPTQFILKREEFGGSTSLKANVKTRMADSRPIQIKPSSGRPQSEETVNKLRDGLLEESYNINYKDIQGKSYTYKPLKPGA